MLLVITPASFAQPLRRFRRHKIDTGLPTEIVTLESIFGSGYAGDEAEQVKRFIADRYRTDLCRHVMLVGDADAFPVRYTKTDRKSEPARDTAFYPSDLYYAGLHRSQGGFDTWDNTGNGYFGELHGETHSGPINIDGVSLVPEVAVGRVPASTVADVRRFVAKCIKYEKNAAHSSWPWNALMVATHDWNGVDWASKTQFAAAEGPLFLYSSTLVVTRGRSRGDAFAEDAVTAAFNRELGLVCYVGHGHATGLAIPTGWWDVHDIAALKNTSSWPIMVAAACDTAGFATLPPYASYIDINGVQHQGTQNGEVFSGPPPQPACIQNWIDPDHDLATHVTVGTPRGAVAYFGGVTGMQYAEPVSLLLEWIAKSSTLGDAWREMIKAYYQLPSIPTNTTQPDWTAVARFHQPWKYMLFGDPSLRIRGVGTHDQASAVFAAA